MEEEELRISACLKAWVGGKYEVVWVTTNDLTELICRAKSLANRPDPCPYPDAFTYVPHLHHDHNSDRFSTVDLVSDPSGARCDFSDGHFTFPSSIVAVGPMIYSFGNVGLPQSLGRDLSCLLNKRRITPELVVLSGKIYVVAGAVDDVDGSPSFIEVFDVSDPLGTSSYISEHMEPPFSSFCQKLWWRRNWMVAPLLGDAGEEKMLVMSEQSTPEFGQGLHSVNVKTKVWVWENFEDKDERLQDYFFRNIIGNPVGVAKDNGFYWLTSNRGGMASLGKMYYYNWKTKQLLHGLIIDGFEFDPEFSAFNAGIKVLLHLKDDLFCLVWFECNCQPVLHLTILQVSKTDSELITRLIGCSRYIIPTRASGGVYDLDGAYLLYG